MFNVGRSLVNPFFVAVLTYLFIAKNLSQGLLAINKINAVINLLLVFSGWGLKDYLVKESYQSHRQFSHNWRLAFYSRFLLVVPLLFVALLCFNGYALLFISFIFLLRTFSQLYEPHILLNRRSGLFFGVDTLAAVIISILIWQDIVTDDVLFFYLVIVSEAVKLFFCRLLFKQAPGQPVLFSELRAFLKNTRFYFFLVLVSFFQSKADLYVLGFLFEPGRFNEYQLLSSLISLAHIVISAFVVSYSRLVYRNIGGSVLAFRTIVWQSGACVAIGSAGLIYLTLNKVYGFDFSVLNCLLAGFNILLFAFVLFEMFYYTRQNWLQKTIQFVLVCGVSNLLLSLLLIKQFTISGALLANTLSALLLALLMRFFRIRETAGKKT